LGDRGAVRGKVTEGAGVGQEGAVGAGRCRIGRAKTGKVIETVRYYKE